MHRTANQPKRSLRILAWTLGSLVVAAVLAFLGGKAWLARYLRSPEFRQMVETKTGAGIRAKVTVQQPDVDGSQFYTNNFTAEGSLEAPFSKLSASNIRGDFKMPSFIALVFGDRKVDVENVDIQRVDAEFFEDKRLEMVLPEKPTGARTVNLKNGTVREMRILWNNGSLIGSSMRITAVEGGWRGDGVGGKLQLPLALPALEVNSARVVYKEQERTFIIQDARGRLEGGEIAASGEFKPKDNADIQLTVKDVSVTPVLPEDWRGRLHGKMFGDARLRLPLEGPNKEMARLSGKVELKEGRLEALPILSKLADYTNDPQFNHLPIDLLSGDFIYDRKDASVRVTNFVIESRQRIRITGGFTIVGDKLDGTFQVGVPPRTLEWLPGAQEKVFVGQRDGYAWTTMQLAGTTSAPKEDLTSRLLIAGKDAIVEKVESTATDAADTAIQTGKKAATGVFDLLFGN